MTTAQIPEYALIPPPEPIDHAANGPRLVALLGELIGRCQHIDIELPGHTPPEAIALLRELLADGGSLRVRPRPPDDGGVARRLEQRCREVFGQDAQTKDVFFK